MAERNEVYAIVSGHGYTHDHIKKIIKNIKPKYLVTILSEEAHAKNERKKMHVLSDFIRLSDGNLKEEGIHDIVVDIFERTEPDNDGEPGELPAVGKIITKFSDVRKNINDNERDKVNWVADLSGATNLHVAAITILAMVNQMDAYYVIGEKDNEQAYRGNELFNRVPYISDINESVNYIKERKASRDTLLFINKRKSETSRHNLATHFEVKDPAVTKRVSPLIKHKCIEVIKERKSSTLVLKGFKVYKVTLKGKIVASMLK